MTLTQKDLDNVLTLSRLSIPEEDKPVYLKQMQTILDYMAMLDELDLSQETPTLSGLNETTPFRNDTAETHYTDLSLNAPLLENNAFLVPQILTDSEGHST